MFSISSLREKFYNVQEEISSGLRNLRIDRHGIWRRKNSDEIQDSNLINLGAGAELLESYEKIWLNIHSLTQQNATKAHEVGVLVSKIHNFYEEERRKMRELSGALANIPKILHGVEEISNLILEVESEFDESEEAVLSLENLIEENESREKELDSKFQLALYQKRHEDELDELKIQLTNEHFVKMKMYEDERNRKLKDRQAVFQAAFETDLELYKEGVELKRENIRKEEEKSLEEIELEEDVEFLEEFLSHPPPPAASE